MKRFSELCTGIAPIFECKMPCLTLKMPLITIFYLRQEGSRNMVAISESFVFVTERRGGKMEKRKP